MNQSIGTSVLPPEIEEKDVVLKRQHCFCVLAEFGDIRTYRSEGVFFRNSRYLSSYRSRLGGEEPVVLSHSTPPGQSRLIVHLVNSENAQAGGRPFGQTALHGRRTVTLEARRLVDRWEWTNYSDGRLEVPFELHMNADFVDIFEVRHWLTPWRREVDFSSRGRTAEFVYRGADAVTRKTRVEWESGFNLLPSPGQILTGNLLLEAGETVDFEIAFSFSSSSASRRQSALPPWQGETIVRTSNTQVNKWMEQSRRDLEMLTARTEQGPYPFAGTPWFAAVFGRDGLITALRTLWLWPSLSRGVLRLLTRHQADEEDAFRAAEPGKILHEMRDSERANLRDVPFGHYYGAVDSTPLYLILAGAYWTRTADQGLLDEIWPALQRAAEWVKSKLEANRFGFLTYRSQRDGLLHQGWRDADDAVYHRDGTDVEGEIALVEVQAYAYRALREMAKLCRAAGRGDLCAQYLQASRGLRERFEAHFWDEESGYYAMALDEEGRPCQILSSAPGHALWMGLPDPERAARVAAKLAGQRFWTGWGVRTVAHGEPRYSPLSYHNGSVWPHDTALCAEGLARYGYRRLACRIFRGLFEASEHLERRRLPELFCGFQREENGGGVVRFPGACSPQAWAAMAPFSLLSSLLGLRLQGRPAHLSLTHPRLPSEVDSVTVENLPIGETRVSFVIESAGSSVRLEVLENLGGCEIDLLL